MTRPTLKSRLFFFLFALLAGLGGGGVAGLEERPCTVHSSDGSYYDLNPLSASKDYDITTPGGHRIILNVCRSVQEETWNLKVDDPKDVAGFIRRDHGDFSIGKTNTTLVMQPDNEGPQLTMRDGSRCTSKSGATQDSTASTTILFTCDTSVFGAGKPQLLWSAPEDEDEACSWLIQWKTHYACPRGERGGIWGFFTFVAVIILLLLTLYLTLGTLYNRYALKLRGFDQLPQFSIEGAKYHVQEMWDVARDADWREVFEG
ncbi:hypothetical protein D9758_012925 [Tetrapyrgos nigripes]|uniref:Autophagy-related protein 27 n=1 Tax=Tetrapyrgos nigripes TaxID=182062 RepID=A0A8H5FPJ9_9AGAR|nr:hypothetical protein D9758_012925 [Tetrapyrgos nigripes]